MLPVLASLCAQVALGAVLPRGTIVFFPSSSCPNADWTPVTDYRGRVFLAAGEGAITTRVNSPAVGALSDAEYRSHTHPDSFTVSLGVLTEATAKSPSCFPGYQYALRAGVTASSSGASSSPTGSPGYAMTQLLACKLSPPTPTYQIDQDAVLFMDPDSSPGAVTSCTTPTADWTSFPTASGRVIVAADPTLVPSWGPTSYVKQSADTAMPTAQGDFSGHSHPVTFPTPSVSTPSYSPASPTQVPAGGGADLMARSASAAHAVTGSYGSASPQIPFARALVCKSTSGVSGGSQVPSGGLAFFATSSCPSGWTASSMYRGRLIVNLPSGASAGTNFGSTTLLDGSGNPEAHSHTTAPFSFTCSIPLTWVPNDVNGKYYCIASPGSSNTYVTLVSAPSPTASMSFSVSSGTVSPSATGNVPYIAILMCSKNAGTPAPVEAPSKAPKTPSRSPSKAPRKPSRAPSRAPRKPSRTPSRTPSNGPSRAPKRTPSKAPTFRPSRAPSRVPTALGQTYKPTLNPSTSPVKTPTLKPSSPPSIGPPFGGIGTSPTPLPSLSAASSTSNNGEDASTTMAIIAGATAGAVVLGLGIAILVYRKWFAGNGKKNTGTTGEHPKKTRGGSYAKYKKWFEMGGSRAPMPTAGQQHGGVLGMQSAENYAFVNPGYSGNGPTVPPVGFNTSPVSSLSSVNSSIRVVANDFTPENPDEIAVFSGEQVSIIEIHGDWLVVRNVRGEVGMIPRNFLAV